MNAATLDTPKAIRTLEAAGIKRKHAEAIAGFITHQLSQ